MKSKKTLLLSVLSLIFVSCSAVCAGAGGSKLKTTQVDSLSQIISNTSKSNCDSKVFLSYHAPSKDVDSIYVNTYSFNFSVFFSEILSYCDDDSFVSFDLDCGNSSLKNISICDTRTYTNPSSEKRFEMININLYKTPNKTEELSTFGLNGFLYIPDYMADDIISKSNGDLKNYLDLVPDLTSWTEQYREAFLKKYAITLKNGDKVIGKFKIANIFHVEGFNDKTYKYNDRGAGKIYKNFFGDYVIGTSNIFNNYNKCIVSYFDSKRFIVEQEINKYINYSSNLDYLLNFYQIPKESSKSILSSIDKNTFQDISVPYILLLCISILFCLESILIGVLFLNNGVDLKRFFLSCLPLLLGEFIFQIIYLTVFKNSIKFISFYNLLFNIPLIIYLLACLIYAFITKRKKNVSLKLK